MNCAGRISFPFLNTRQAQIFMHHKKDIINEIDLLAKKLGTYERCMIGVVADPEKEKKGFARPDLNCWKAQSSKDAIDIQVHFIENGMFPHCRTVDDGGRWIIVY